MSASAARFWFPSSRLGTPLQAKLLLCERMVDMEAGHCPPIRLTNWCTVRTLRKTFRNRCAWAYRLTRKA
jgi:hypothetical protein